MLKIKENQSKLKIIEEKQEKYVKIVENQRKLEKNDKTVKNLTIIDLKKLQIKENQRKFKIIDFKMLKIKENSR